MKEECFYAKEFKSFSNQDNAFYEVENEEVISEVEAEEEEVLVVLL